jgi:hypothetical protein
VKGTLESSTSGARIARWASLLGVKGAAGAWALERGFTHVSDDDYARVVIAEQFAHAPSLDPSGTSWLPFPFWAHGAAMLAFGRSLGVALTASWLLGLASVLVAYFALRVADIGRTASWIAAALVATTPWNAWLGVASVPEAWTAALVFFGAMTLVTRKWRIAGAACLLAASLSRYEAWPVCAVFAGACLLDAARAPAEERGRLGGALALAVVGPCAWMAWNAHAHGSALHFVARVTAFHRAHAGSAGTLDRALQYPIALVESAPELTAVALLGLAGGRTTLARWRRPLVAGGALAAFLVYGDLHDGAPTHHPERALVALWWILGGFGVDGMRAWIARHAWGRPRREAWVVAFGMAAGIGLVGMRGPPMRDHPGEGEEEERRGQVARGLALRRDGVEGFVVVPCDYEHFAVIAAYGAPERVVVEGATHGRVTRECPRVTVR